MEQEQDSQQLALEQQRQRLVSAGMTFESLVQHPGWGLVTELLKSYETSQIEDLLNVRSSDPNVVQSKLMAAKAISKLRLKLLGDINSTIQQAKDILLAYRTESEEEEL